MKTERTCEGMHIEEESRRCLIDGGSCDFPNGSYVYCQTYRFKVRPARTLAEEYKPSKHRNNFDEVRFLE